MRSLQLRSLAWIGTLALCALFSGQAVAAENLIPNEIREQFDLPEDKLDIGIVALLLAQEIYPAVDVQGYSRKIDALVFGASSVIQKQGKYDPDSVIRALNTFFYKMHGLRYDRSLRAWEKTENYYLNGILDTKEGICLTMPLLYMSVAQRLGYPIYPVSIPEHLFLRYVSPSIAQRNIEATGGGGYVPDEHYIKESRVGEAGLRSGAYLQTLTYREFLAGLLDIHAVTWAKRGKDEKAIAYLEKAIELNPKCAGCYYNLGASYVAKGKQQAGDVARNYAMKAKIAFGKSQQLGYVKPFSKRTDSFRSAQ